MNEFLISEFQKEKKRSPEEVPNDMLYHEYLSPKRNAARKNKQKKIKLKDLNADRDYASTIKYQIPYRYEKSEAEKQIESFIKMINSGNSAQAQEILKNEQNQLPFLINKRTANEKNVGRQQQNAKRHFAMTILQKMTSKDSSDGNPLIRNIKQMNLNRDSKSNSPKNSKHSKNCNSLKSKQKIIHKPKMNSEAALIENSKELKNLKGKSQHLSTLSSLQRRSKVQNLKTSPTETDILPDSVSDAFLQTMGRSFGILSPKVSPYQQKGADQELPGPSKSTESPLKISARDYRAGENIDHRKPEDQKNRRYFSVKTQPSVIISESNSLNEATENREPISENKDEASEEQIKEEKGRDISQVLCNNNMLSSKAAAVWRQAHPVSTKEFCSKIRHYQDKKSYDEDTCFMAKKNDFLQTKRVGFNNHTMDISGVSAQKLIHKEPTEKEKVFQRSPNKASSPDLMQQVRLNGDLNQNPQTTEANFSALVAEYLKAKAKKAKRSTELKGITSINYANRREQQASPQTEHKQVSGTLYGKFWGVKYKSKKETAGNFSKSKDDQAQYLTRRLSQDRERTEQTTQNTKYSLPRRSNIIINKSRFRTID